MLEKIKNIIKKPQTLALGMFLMGLTVFLGIAVIQLGNSVEEPGDNDDTQLILGAENVEFEELKPLNTPTNPPAPTKGKAISTNTPTPKVTNTPTPTNTSTPTLTDEPTSIPTSTPTNTPTDTPTFTPTPTETATSSATPT